MLRVIDAAKSTVLLLELSAFPTQVHDLSTIVSCWQSAIVLLSVLFLVAPFIDVNSPASPWSRLSMCQSSPRYSCFQQMSLSTDLLQRLILPSPLCLIASVRRLLTDEKKASVVQLLVLIVTSTTALALSAVSDFFPFPPLGLVLLWSLLPTTRQVIFQPQLQLFF